MSYANPDRRFYSVPVADVSSIQGPKGKEGRLISIHVAATTTFTAGTAKIGTAANDDAFASFAFADLADTDSVCTDDGVTDTDAIIDPVIPADTQVEVTTANGGAGAGNMVIIIDWAR